jgi:hypothetical protein
MCVSSHAGWSDSEYSGVGAIDNLNCHVWILIYTYPLSGQAHVLA